MPLTQVQSGMLSTGGPSWDSNGNVGIGTTVNNVFDQVAGARPLVVQKSDTSTTVNGSTASVTITNADTTTSNTAQLNFAAITGASTNQYSSAVISCIFGARTNAQYPTGILTFSTSTSLNSAPTEKARIDSSGNLLVGYNKAQIWDELISGSRNTNAVVGGFYSSSSSYTSSVIRCQTETAAGTGWYFFEGRASGGSFQYGIRGNGTVATSDERRKKNVEPARSYLADVCGIPVVKYNWKTDSDDAPKELGWLAQDVAKVFPNMVVTHHDGPNDDQEVLLLKKEVFLPMLMKCIQEQQQMIETLQAKVAALELR